MSTIVPGGQTLHYWMVLLDPASMRYARRSLLRQKGVIMMEDPTCPKTASGKPWFFSSSVGYPPIEGLRRDNSGSEAVVLSY